MNVAEGLHNNIILDLLKHKLHDSFWQLITCTVIAQNKDSLAWSPNNLGMFSTSHFYHWKIFPSNDDDSSLGMKSFGNPMSLLKVFHRMEALVSSYHN